eukprot:TRINITY_DN2840_c0_g1::TRINITY_DN2840_c0_g1_i1::g.6126::m.6126 TRINITY_DN2840_c0_g1::TRINITY_DN2840_c0_g1_i1::g.6126  ORF type:complete len:356 (+),score=55.69,UVR/PF02151.14/0.023,UVR/PF02151.14/3.5,DUF843/PF05814.6/0.0013,DUF2360/PF10152.4/1.7 TRINITY_DN2840_c0_g1_i1:34-1068(+)
MAYSWRAVSRVLFLLVLAVVFVHVGSVDFSKADSLQRDLENAVKDRSYLKAAELKDQVDKVLQDMLQDAIKSRDYLGAAEVKARIDGTTAAAAPATRSSSSSSSPSTPQSSGSSAKVASTPRAEPPKQSQPKPSSKSTPPLDNDNPDLPRIPYQFSGRIELATKHLPRDNEYPPAWKHIDVKYDWVNKRAWSYIHTSYEKKKGDEGTTYLRRYDLGYEYEIAQFGPQMVCKRSRILNAKMPRPSLLSPNAYKKEITTVRGIQVEHWEEELGHGTLHFYRRVDTKAPVRLENDDMIYDFLEWKEGEPNFDWEIPSEFRPHEAHCEKVPQDVGFPYVHLLGPYVRF